MAKGMYSQGVCLLTDGQTTIEQIKSALAAQEFEIAKEVPAQDTWQFGGPTVIVAYEPEVNGYVAVDVINEVWPDSMGDPKSDPMTFAAWSMGHFGPFAFPGGLERAGQHSWLWEEGRTVAQRHRGFIRIRMSYAFGAKDDTPILPEEYSPLAELVFLNYLVMTLFELPGVICYFNPGGEVLRDKDSFSEVCEACEEQEKIPLPLWMNVRFFNVNEQLALMDTVGNSQLDLPDVEAVFPHAKYDPTGVDYYLRNVTHYLMGLDRELRSGEEIDGPGESNLSWTTEMLSEGTVQPPRRILRLYPKDIRKDVQNLLPAASR